MVTAPMAMPMVPTPTPVPVPMPPMPMPSSVPVPVVVPTDLLRLEMIDLVLGNDSRFYTLGARSCESPVRQSW